MAKPNTGYKKKPKIKKKKTRYVSSLLIAPTKKVSLNERIIKFLIYIALRLAIRPRKWKDPRKNYEIIDRTYKRIMSADFVFIPSSIAIFRALDFLSSSSRSRSPARTISLAFLYRPSWSVLWTNWSK